jgi:mannosyltransferase OCH1-like enzyme
MIPRVIHYCWFGGSPLPASVDRCLSSWRQFCPGYEIRYWDETSFPVDRCRFSLEAYAAGKWAFVSDYARLRIVFDHGGIYLDTDVELIAPLDRLLPHSAFFGFESRGAIATGLGFGATAGNQRLFCCQTVGPIPPPARSVTQPSSPSTDSGSMAIARSETVP